MSPLSAHVPTYGGRLQAGNKKAAVDVSDLYKDWGTQSLPAGDTHTHERVAWSLPGQWADVGGGKGSP